MNHRATELCPKCKEPVRRLTYQKRNHGRKLFVYSEIAYCDMCKILLLVDPSIIVYAKYVHLKPLTEWA